MVANYRSPSSSELQYFNSLGNALDFYSKSYENIVLLGDFNITVEEKRLAIF